MKTKLREWDIPNAKRYAGPVKRLALALIAHGESPEEAFAFIASAEGITDQMKPQLAAWFRENLPAVEARADCKEVREACACCLGGKRAAAARAIRDSEPTREGRIARLLETPVIVGCGGEMLSAQSFRVWFFPRGQGDFYRCSCLRFGPGEQTEPMPRSYCDCCAGHLKHHIGIALGCPVAVTVETSCLTTCGREGCSFLVSLCD